MELPERYRLAGEWLYADRDPNLAWDDGSNWQDGESHEVPALPLAESAYIAYNMTCAQWETLNIASFPKGEDLLEWYLSERADEIEDQ